MTTIRDEWVETLRGVDTASIYNILKGLGRAEPGTTPGPSCARCSRRWGRWPASR